MSTHYRGSSGSAIGFLGDRVRKTAHPGGEAKLCAQHRNTLALRETLGDRAVEVFDWCDDHYDMVFCPGVTFDVYCTMTTQRIAFARLREIVAALWQDLYSTHRQSPDVAGYLEYLIQVAHGYASLGPDVGPLVGLLEGIGERLTGNTFLETGLGGVIHGDLTFENIIVTADSFVLIDSNPSPAGAASMAMDLGKLRQSLFSRWELPKFTGPKARAGLEATYSYLADRFAYLAPHWNEPLEHESRFYEASHYIRLLPYRHRADPQSGPAYLARAIGILEETLDVLRDPIGAQQTQKPCGDATAAFVVQ